MAEGAERGYIAAARPMNDQLSSDSRVASHLARRPPPPSGAGSWGSRCSSSPSSGASPSALRAAPRRGADLQDRDRDDRGGAGLAGAVDRGAHRHRLRRAAGDREGRREGDGRIAKVNLKEATASRRQILFELDPSDQKSAVAAASARVAAARARAQTARARVMVAKANAAEIAQQWEREKGSSPRRGLGGDRRRSRARVKALEEQVRPPTPRPPRPTPRPPPRKRR